MRGCNHDHWLDVHTVYSELSEYYSSLVFAMDILYNGEALPDLPMYVNSRLENCSPLF
jgi:hypothetical protein